jgi:hypothetical protein
MRLGRDVPNSAVATTRVPGSIQSSARSYLCNGNARDREQPTNNQVWGHAVAKEQHARNQGEHRKQQTEGCDAVHGARGDQPEPKAKANKVPPMTRYSVQRGGAAAVDESASALVDERAVKEGGARINNYHYTQMDTSKYICKR